MTGVLGRSERMLCEDLVGRGNWCALGMMTEIESTERRVAKEVCRHRLPEPLQIMIKSLAFILMGIGATQGF